MIALYYDYTSLASFVAYLDVHAAADRLNLTGQVASIGIDVLGIGASIPATIDQHQDYERYHRPLIERGLSVRRPDRRPPTLSAHLIAEITEDPQLRREWDLCVFAAYWEQSVDIADHAWLVQAWRDLCGTANIELVLADVQRHQQLRRRMVTLRQRGVGGVPLLDAEGTLLPALQPGDDLESVLTTFAA